MLKLGYHVTCDKTSAKHLARYVNEFAGRHNIRDLDWTPSARCRSLATE